MRAHHVRNDGLFHNPVKDSPVEDRDVITSFLKNSTDFSGGMQFVLF
jgi:hypothetical protein